MYYIGIDLGGTKLLTAIIDKKGNMIESLTIPTQGHLGPKAVIGRIVESVEDVLHKGGLKLNNIKAIGVGAPGQVDPKSGNVRGAPNLGWKNIPLKKILEKRLRRTIDIENDAAAAALAEYKFGTGKGTRNFVYVTLSTGIGGGLVLEGDLYRGIDGSSGEIGHTVVKPDGPFCLCGRQGCLEALSSGTAIAKAARDIVKKKGSKTLLFKLVNGNINKITAETVHQAVKKGDITAIKVLNEAAMYLGIGLANVVNLFNPEVIALGGGVSNIGTPLFRPMMASLKEHSLDAPFKRVKVVKARFGKNVGVLGAAAACF